MPQSKLIAEATKPGLLGRAGLAMEIRCRQALERVFDTAGSAFADEYPTSEKLAHAADRICLRAASQLEHVIVVHGKAAYQLATKQVALWEADDRLATEQKSLARVSATTTAKQAAAYARVRSAQAIKDIDETTRAGVQKIIADGIEAGESTFTIVQKLRKLFDGFSKSRAANIANTEMNMAMSTASFAKIKSVGLNYKRAIASPGACEICVGNEMAGAIPVDTPFPSGHLYTPFHPGKCRCAITGVRDERKDDYGEDSSEK